MPSDIGKRLDRLESIEEIKHLKALYCMHCDNGFDPDGIASLFTEDAVWDGGGHRGVQRGRDGIRAYFVDRGARIPFSAHFITNPRVIVDGERADGWWLMLMPFVTDEDHLQGPRWQRTEYHDTFTRVDGRWLFQSVKVDLKRLDNESGQWLPA